MKKTTLRMLTAALAVVMLFAVAACGKTSKTVTMGTNAGFPPFEFIDGSETVGIDVEIAKEIAKDMGKELSITDMEFASVVPAVQSGKVDMGIAGMTVNEERLKQVDFSETYFKASQLVIVPKGSTLTTADLKGKKIGVQDGTTGDSYVEETFGPDSVSKFSNAMDAVIAMNSNKIEAIVIDSYTANALAAKNDTITILPEELTSEEYAIAVKKGNKAVLDSINKTLARLKQEGKIEEFTKKYVD